MRDILAVHQFVRKAFCHVRLAAIERRLVKVYRHFSIVCRNILMLPLLAPAGPHDFRSSLNPVSLSDILPISKRNSLMCKKNCSELNSTE